MPIRVNLDVVLAQRKRRLTDLAEAVGITIQNLSVLKTGRARAMRFSTLEAICRELRCQPGDILEYWAEVPGDEQPETASPGAERPRPL
ncbi:MAG: helix-turn-helix transcriptional regulator [Vicinamibacterales bacterium]|jgi:putative transcriptional regulator|nr:helix-turn-helix transcriptional regulator [Vicinamibacterales bacterium]